jgi:DNA-binding CsgD family transcriptional regulator
MPRRPQKTIQPIRRALVVATSTGKIQFAESAARNWLKRFFAAPVRVGHLPPKVCDWLERDFTETRPTCLISKHGDAQLFVKRLRPHPLDSVSLILEIDHAKGQQYRKHRALTRRENQVLQWLSCGKTNRDIGEILGMASATVGKHLERIYPKLGVENRTAAAHFARRM